MGDKNTGSVMEKITKLNIIKDESKRKSTLLGVLVGVLILIIAVQLNLFSRSAEQSPGNLTGNQFKLEQDTANLLPQKERSIEGENEQVEVSRRAVAFDPFSGPVILKGVILGGSGSNLAILEADNTTYIAATGDIIQEFWEVKEINLDSVLLLGEGQYKQVNLAATGYLEARKGPGAGQNIAIDVRDVDLRDMLSALAIKMNVNIILVEKPLAMSFQIHDVSPRQALEFLLQKEGYSYLQEDKVIVVGNAKKLESDFYNKMVLTRFDLIYVPADMLKPLINQLGIPVKNITLDTNLQAIWVQGTPQALLKTQELISAVDRPENARVIETVAQEDVAQKGVSLEFRQITTYFLAPARVVQLLQDAGVQLQKYVVLGNKLYVFEQDLFDHWEEIKNLVAQLDNGNSVEKKARVFSFRNISALEAAEILAQFEFPGVRIVNFQFPELGHQFLVIYPPHLEIQIEDSVASIDDSRRWRINAPIMSAKGEHALNELKAKRELLSVMANIPSDRMVFSGNLSGDPKNPHYVLWAYETPATIKKLQDLVRSFDQ